MSLFSHLHRLEFDGVPLYIDSEKPDWFVPSSHTDRLLQSLQNCCSHEEAVSTVCTAKSHARTILDITTLQELLTRQPEKPYKGRYNYLQLNTLKEIWFHLTDKCNLSCRHCLFGASPTKQDSLDKKALESAIDQAAEMGCRLFYFTGGEPFLYQNFHAILNHVLNTHPASHAVILTNSLLLQDNLDKLMQLDHSRLHLQISLDGLQPEHDFLRGKGSFAKLETNLKELKKRNFAVTISIAINSANVDSLPEIAKLAANFDASSLHFMYHFIRGKGTSLQFVNPTLMFNKIVETIQVCTKLNLRIDNIETLKSQIFSIPGTKYDLSNMAWESLAVGPDSHIYPSPALIGVKTLRCGAIKNGLKNIWEGSSILHQIRKSSLIDSQHFNKYPLRFLTGGNDPDHSYISGNTFVGHDPYTDLYDLLTLYLIVEQAKQYPDQGLFRLRMGDFRCDCPDNDAYENHDNSVKMTHCNCVVSLADNDTYKAVKNFYGTAANHANEEIINPFGPKDQTTSFIPENSIKRSYGCGSPVQDAALQAGETLVDLGSGSGVECFLAAANVGPDGLVFGIDMTDDMLDLASSSKQNVVKKLGYDNIEFRKGYLENIPLPDSSAHVVISNCVINLSPDKRKTYLEIFRILKPGGRLIISDVVTDANIDLSIKNSMKHRGECLGGAMRQKDLITMLSDCGFTATFFHKRYPYRKIGNNRFFSLTYEAKKPLTPSIFDTVTTIMYRGPHQALITDQKTFLTPGSIMTISSTEAARLGKNIFQLNSEGAVTNIEQAPCSCSPPSLRQIQPLEIPKKVKFPRGCMACGTELVYNNQAQERTCHFCQSIELSNSSCRKNHFVCDTCHQEKGLKIIQHICLTSAKKDMIELANIIRSHPGMPMHGPEHHALVPGVILAAYKNSGGNISEKIIQTGIDRARKIPGGVCGFWGVCGAAIGAGIAASLILDATPLTARRRQLAQSFSAAILSAIAAINGARCCQRETWIALQETAKLSKKYFNLLLEAQKEVRCSQFTENKECIKKQCPLWEKRDTKTPDSFHNLAN